MVIRRPSRNRMFFAKCSAFMVAWLEITSACLGQTQGPPKKKVDIEPNVVVIPLRGTVGIFKDDFDALPKRNQIPDFVTSDIVRGALDEAKKSKPEAVVLEISGPGGDVDEMCFIVNMLMDEQDNGLRVIAWIGPDVISADAEIALACKELVAKSLCQIGACVIWRHGVNGERIDVRGKDGDPVARKMYAALVAPVQQAQDKARRPRCVEEAMRVMEAELWWHPQKGLAATIGKDDGWEQVDKANDVLMLSSEQLIKFGLAIGKADDETQLLKALELPATTKVRRLDGYMKIRRHNAAQKALKSWQRIVDFLNAYKGIAESFEEAKSRPDTDARTRRALLVTCADQIRITKDMLDRLELNKASKAPLHEQLDGLAKRIFQSISEIDATNR